MHEPARSERVLRIRGGKPLQGAVTIGGAKNAALPALAATLLTGDECILTNVPDLADIETMLTLLRSLGAEAEHDRERKRIRIRAAAITSTGAPADLVARMRASFLVAGPLLARCGEVSASAPGGCQLGARPVDVDVRGFRQMGAEVDFSDEGREIHARASNLRGTPIYMDYPSHTGTENLLMAATLASGRTTIVHAACEPEIVHLGNMLIRMGARIQGLGSPTIVVDGVDRLHGVSERILPDRLEAGTFAIGAVASGGEVMLEDVREEDMLPLTAKLREAGAEVWSDANRMLIRPGDRLSAVEIQTLPFPGFPTDLQAAFAVLMTQAHGLSKIHERVFDDRLRYTDQLRAMGATIEVPRFVSMNERGAPIPGAVHYGTRAEILGPTPLQGNTVRCLDIRAGAGVVLAGLVASGETVVSALHHLDRGYEGFVDKLRALGADIAESTMPVAELAASA
ncbi:MAG: UDP-N-acetylglucosamine 1-carboxyvinyltransferase [Thermomicrobiales bacterium]|nr:UDP-N-acetylglucosamine 1-carboxyvinyltransferase [Thermomicrobiales bacterium]